MAAHLLVLVGFLFSPPPSDTPPLLDPAPLVAAFAQHQWRLVALLVAPILIGFVIRILKDDTWLPTLPKGWRTLAAWALGLTTGVLAHVTAGVPWDQAIAGGLLAAFGAIFGHVTLIEGLRSGEEIPMPAWLRKTPDSNRLPSSSDPPPPPPEDT